MIALVVAGVFAGLFGMWVVLPRMFLNKLPQKIFAAAPRPSSRDQYG